ncbi:MAG: DUF6088 family protein [Chitinophagaceae bacterium]
MKPASKQIIDAISLKTPGEILFLTDFRGLGTDSAIRTTLSRMSLEGKLKRLAQGIYLKPKIDPVLGELLPGPEELAQTIAEKEQIRIKPSGAYALNKLGLSTQVPTRLVYITDGKSRQIRLGKTVILFKETTPKKLSMKGKYSSLIIQALGELDLRQVDPIIEQKLMELLGKETGENLLFDLKLAPSKVHDYIVQLLKKMKNDRLVIPK